jgi:hypothetical protein
MQQTVRPYHAQGAYVDRIFGAFGEPKVVADAETRKMEYLGSHTWGSFFFFHFRMPHHFLLLRGGGGSKLGRRFRFSQPEYVILPVHFGTLAA